MIIEINSQDFIEKLSSEEQVAIFFSLEDPDSNKIENKLKTVVDNFNKESIINKKVYKLNIFANDKNNELCEYLDVQDNILIVYKNSCFNRYKNKQFTDAELKKFLGLSIKKKGSS